MESSYGQISDTRNPWSSQDKSLTGLKRALLLGVQTGHIASRQEFEDNGIDTETQSLLPSMKLIQVLKKMARARAELNKINLEIQCRMQDKETRDVTHLDILEKRIEKIKQLNSHIESVIDDKDQLIQRLQQPFQGEYLKLEAQYHRFACEVFQKITPLLGELSTNLENITWAKSLSFNDGRLDALISELYSTLNAMQTSFQSLCQIQQSVGQLHKVETSNLHSTKIESL
ncbi:hypothetical protein ACF0H5_001438 [Mactra antiquata]